MTENNTCPKCGQTFHCGAHDDEPCWCSKLPPALPAPKPGTPPLPACAPPASKRPRGGHRAAIGRSWSAVRAGRCPALRRVDEPAPQDRTILPCCRRRRRRTPMPQSCPGLRSIRRQATEALSDTLQCSSCRESPRSTPSINGVRVATNNPVSDMFPVCPRIVGRLRPKWPGIWRS